MKRMFGRFGRFGRFGKSLYLCTFQTVRTSQTCRNRQGSALLIVLGMLAFLIVSAVAFSAFMRHSRLPSSFLLRMSSSRQLVKAGLAEALDELDRAIGDNPHPGVGTEAGKDPNDPNKIIPNRNQWRNRVFLGTNMTVDVEQTVSTLTLEGLAYVPAPLINEVRYYSRRSPAAVWHTLGFDSGRFAFTAVDVSDYFDVNRMMAAPGNDSGRGGRTSAADGRIALAYLFEDTGHTGWRTQPDAWDEFMDTYLGTDPSSGSTVPFVSVADFNLAVWDKKPAGILSPWCRFIENGTEFVQDNAAERQALSNLVFITDSWYPPRRSANSAQKDASLASSANQPLTGIDLVNPDGYQNRGFEDVLVAANARKIFDNQTRSWADKISPPEMLMLADYLDADSVPTSLALPTAERTPMVTGVSLIGTLEMETKPGATYSTPDQADANGKYRYDVTPYTISVRGDPKLMAGLVYPFKHSRGQSKSYSVQAFATITFVQGGTDNLRPGSTTSWAMVPKWAGVSEQQPQAGVFAGVNNPNNRPSGLYILSGTTTVRLPAQVKTDDDAALEDQNLEFGNFNFELSSELPESFGGVTGLHRDKCTLRKIQKIRLMPNPNGGDPIPTPEGDPDVEYGAFPATDDLNGIVENPSSVEFVPVVQAWVRVTDPNANDQAVDLVPACWQDDKRPCEILGDEAAGSKLRPALRFRDGAGAVKFKVEKGVLSCAGTVTFAPQGYMADDPRFNYAPENFIALAQQSGEFKQIWLTSARTRSANRDGDIFMATSDAGYLQSKYEIAFLPRISGFNENVDYGCLTGGGYDGKARDSFVNCPADAAMWNTYSPYKVGGRTADIAMNEWPVVSGSGGSFICPYTPDTAVMMGALANTPFDWWAAATNGAVSAVKETMLSKVDEALKYTFSDHATDAAAKIHYRNMEALARKFIADFHNSSSVDGWKVIYESMDWDDSLFTDIENGSSVTLDSVDRKFLYGYWRECFDVRQQLFLVFVRAEPMMMGGGAGGYMPPMLGARAVALVWRDPTPTKNNAPHRMRVLFYRQFD